MHSRLKHLFRPDVNLLGRTDSCSRYDQQRLKKWKLIVGATFLLPLRLLVCAIMIPPGFLLGIFTYYLFCNNDSNYLKPKWKIYRCLTYYPKTFLSYILFFFLGFYNIKTKYFDIRDFWPDYRPPKKLRAGLIVSNHVSIFDMYMYLLLRENPAFLSKEAVKNVPMIGFYAKMHQTIFFSRKDEK